MNSKNFIQLPFSRLNGNISIKLPASKSISNRALLINKLAGDKTSLLNLSAANDTALMSLLLHQNDDLVSAQDAGTTYRFLLAYYSLTNQKKLLTGTERMKKRPIQVLVDAICSLGGKIRYEGVEGYPPISTLGFENQLTDKLSIRADISSQYISALMMMAPLLPKGLTLELQGKTGSRPYIDMTARIMEYFGIKVRIDSNIIRIEKQDYVAPDKYIIEPDWSAASYWYSAVALQKGLSIFLDGLKKESIQGDSHISQIMSRLGVSTKYNREGAHLSSDKTAVDILYQDFTDCPDLAQTVVVCCAALGIKGYFTGLESLRIKETDRLSALQIELGKFGVHFREQQDSWVLEGKINSFPNEIAIDTYEDHRMAMSFFPICLLGPLKILDPKVVAKSYPHFWEDVKANII